MKILNPNTGEEIVPILKNHIYVSITDYGLKSWLKEIKINPGQHTWYWVEFIVSGIIDVSNIGSHYCSFDNAINRAINDSYCTIYEFNNYEEMIMSWNDIKYIDQIATIYKSKEE